MSTKIAIADQASDGIEVDLWGALFTVRPRTKDVDDEIEDKLAEITKRFAKQDDLDRDAVQIKIIAERMDVWLISSAGGKKKASTVIKEKWDANELTVVQLNRFWVEVQEEMSRPT